MSSTEPIVRDVVGAYLEEKKGQHACGMFGVKALDRARRRLTTFNAAHGDKLVSACNQRTLIEWVKSHPEWESSHTKADAAGVIVSCFLWAAQQGIIKHSPFTRPKGAWAPIMPRVAISPAEYQAVMRSAKLRGFRRARLAFRLGLFFLWETGARTCEMRELTWENIDFATGLVSLTEHKTAHSTGQARLIVLTPKLWRLLQWIRRRRKMPTTGNVFINSQRRPWEVGRFANYFRKVARFAGIRVTISPYCLRHGFTVRGLENGVGERQLADLLGHATTRYIAWYGRSTRAHGDYLRGVLGQVHGKRP